MASKVCCREEDFKNYEVFRSADNGGGRGMCASTIVGWHLYPGNRNNVGMANIISFTSFHLGFAYCILNKHKLG